MAEIKLDLWAMYQADNSIVTVSKTSQGELYHPIDGNLATLWWTDERLSGWWKIDLGQIRELSKIRYCGYPNIMRFWTSPDDIVYTQINGDYIGEGGVLKDIILDPHRNARYVKASTYSDFNEIEIYEQVILPTGKASTECSMNLRQKEEVSLAMTVRQEEITVVDLITTIRQRAEIDLTAAMKQRTIIDLLATIRQWKRIDLIETIRQSGKKEVDLIAIVDQLSPVPPQNVQAVDIEKGDSIVLTWDENIEPNVLFYKIYKRDNGEWIFVGQTEKPPYQVGGLQKGQTYYFAVSAVVVGLPGPRWIHFTTETWDDMGTQRWID